MYRFSIIILTVLVSIVSCSRDTQSNGIPMEERVFYEIFVHAFYDSNGDGIGDLKGVTAKLDYLEELGVSGLWLLPIHPSPSYHKYDVEDYYGIHPDYGTMDDFKELLDEAHKRNILVIIDMVINHSASTHPYFVEARKGPDNPYRNYYVWSSDTLLQKEEPYHWHRNGDDPEKYYGFFWKGMPDLNYDEPAVREEMKKVGRYWIEDVGVDGYRLDAIRYIYPDSLYDLNVEWWQEYRAALESSGQEVFTVAELWADKDYVAPFLDQGVHAAFNFDLSFAIEKMLLDGMDPGISSLLSEIQSCYDSYSSAWYDATFIKNHDQDRIMSILDDEGKVRLAASLLFTLPGIPFVYYGEEIGMKGKKPDEHIREPMRWAPEGEDPGQTRWIEPLYSTDKTVTPLSLQMQDDGSIYSHYRKLIELRKKFPVLARGMIVELEVPSTAICAYRLDLDGQIVRVFHNLTCEAIRLDKKYCGSLKKVLYAGPKVEQEGGSYLLGPYQSLVLELASE